jgi:phosphatidylcholine synthase
VAWTQFTGPGWAQVGLAVTSIYLLLAGIVQQIVPER